MEKDKVKVVFIIWMAEFIKVNGKMIFNMDMEFKKDQINMKGIGKEEINVGMELFCFRIIQNIMDNFFKDFLMVMENTKIV